MLMFDNDIFASFIPQLLMLLGYLSCFLAPIIPTLTALNADIHTTDRNDVKHEVTVYFDANSNQIVTGSVQNFQAVWDVQLNTEVFTVYASVISKTYFRKEDFKFKSKLFTYSLFSRPPPFSC